MHDIFSYLEFDVRYVGANPFRKGMFTNPPRSIYTDLFADFFGPDTPTPAVTVHDFDGDDPDSDDSEYEVA